MDLLKAQDCFVGQTIRQADRNEIAASRDFPVG